MYFFSLCWMVVFKKLSWKYVNSIKCRNVALKWCTGREALKEDVQAQVIVVGSILEPCGGMGGASFTDTFQAG